MKKFFESRNLTGSINIKMDDETIKQEEAGLEQLKKYIDESGR